jgi:hypothetical protein
MLERRRKGSLLGTPNMINVPTIDARTMPRSHCGVEVVARSTQGGESSPPDAKVEMLKNSDAMKVHRS